MSNKYLNILYLLTTIIIYYLLKYHNSFLILVSLILYLIFSNLLTTLISNHNSISKNLLPIFYLNFLCTIISLMIGLILEKIFYLSNSIIICLLISFLYPLKTLYSLILFPKPNSKYNYSKLFLTILNSLTLIIGTYLSLNILNLNIYNTILIIIISLCILNYLCIFFLSSFPKKKIPLTHLKSHSHFYFSNHNLTFYILTNYNYFLTYISLVYLFYLYITRYYYSYHATSNILTLFYLYLNIITILILKIILSPPKPSKYNYFLLVALLLISLSKPLIFLISLENLLYYHLSHQKLKSSSNSLLNYYLFFGLLTKLLFTIPLINIFYSLNYNPLLGDILLNIFLYLFLIISLKKYYFSKTVAPNYN